MISKKGSSMVEATIILPIIILVLISLISIVVYMYKEVEKNVATHLAITNAIGIEEGTTYYFGKIPKDVEIKKEVGWLYTRVEGKARYEVVNLGVLSEKLKKEVISTGEGINEKEYIWIKDFIKKE